MAITSISAGTITPTLNIPVLSSIETTFNDLSGKYVSRLSADNSLMQEGGCFTNYLASNFNENGGGLRVFSSKNADNTPNTTKMYTSYQLSCIRQHTNSTTFTTYAFNDSDNNGVVRKSTGAAMLSAAMFTALKSTLLNAVYPVNSIYVDYTGSATTCPLTAFGGTWTKPAGNPTVNITVSGSQVDAPIWQRTA